VGGKFDRDYPLWEFFAWEARGGGKLTCALAGRLSNGVEARPISERRKAPPAIWKKQKRRKS